MNPKGTRLLGSQICTQLCPPNNLYLGSREKIKPFCSKLKLLRRQDGFDFFRVCIVPRFMHLQHTPDLKPVQWVKEEKVLRNVFYDHVIQFANGAEFSFQAILPVQMGGIELCFPNFTADIAFDLRVKATSMFDLHCGLFHYRVRLMRLHRRRNLPNGRITIYAT